MGKLLAAIAIGSLVWVACAPGAYADEPGRGKKRVVRADLCGGMPCIRPCPDGYSCYPLYGAYGPYGGVNYWGAYTFTGWGVYPYRR